MFHRGQIIFDVSGERRAAMSVADLLELFRHDQGEELSDDALLLG
jgi:putative ABC transport system ATP-binding protein